MIESYFQKLGFNPTETKVYLALAESGKSTAGLLAKRISLARTTVYSVLDNLISKGLVAIEKKGNSTYFTANKPQAILRGIADEKKQLSEKELIAKELVELATPYFKSQFFSIPKLQFFEGKKNVENMLYDHLADWQASIYTFDKTWWGYQDHTFVEQYRPWLDFTWKGMAEDEKINLVSNIADVEKPLKGAVRGRTIKQISKSFDFSSTIWVLGDYIVLIMSRYEPHYAFQLKDSVFAANLRLVFSLLWSQLKTKK